MGVWPSRGIYLHGVEVKVSRQDWLKEKDQPEKAEEICRFCDFWWIAAGTTEIVRDGELPVDWGLLVPDVRGKLRVAKSPTKRPEPTPITRSFLAAVLRKVTEASAVFTQVDAEIKKQVDAQVADAKRTLANTNDSFVARQLKDYESLKRNVAAFEQNSGIRIDRYSDYFDGEIGTAVNTLRSVGIDTSASKRLLETESILVRLAGQVKAQREAIESVKVKIPSEVSA